MSRAISKLFNVELSSIQKKHVDSSPRQTAVCSSEWKGSDVGDGQDSQLPRVMIVVALIGLVALGITSYLGWVALNSSKVAGCGGGSIFDCNDVINSRWSRWLGIPVSFVAFGMYATMIASVAVGSMKRISNRTRNIACGLVVATGLSAGLAAIWFISLQIFVLKHLCTYCLAAHSCGLTISVLLMWFRPLGSKAFGYLSLLSLLGFGVLVGGQLLFKPVTYKVIEFETPAQNSTEVETFEFAPVFEAPAAEPTEEKTSAIQSIRTLRNQSVSVTNLRQAMSWVIYAKPLIRSQISLFVCQDYDPTAPENIAANSTAASGSSLAATQTAGANQSNQKARRFVSMSGGSLRLDIAQWPLAGKQDAKYIFVEMYDYTCDHCRRTHAAIAGAKTVLNGDVAVVALPIPLNTKCNNAITQTGPRMAEACEISKLAVAVWRVDPSKFDEFHNYLMTTLSVVTYGEAIAKAGELVDAVKLNEVVASEIPGQYIAQHVELYKKVGAGNVPKLLFPTTSIVGEFASPEALVDVIKSQLK